jgi:parallel beta-helix repeat protein
MKSKIAALVVALVALLAAAPQALAREIKVRPGESIQAAIDRAHGGDTIKLAAGTYHENVLISKDNIKLRGSGWRKTVIEPAATPNPVCGAGDGGFVNAICVADIDENFNVKTPVYDVHVTRLSVTGFSGFGVFFFGANGAVVRHVRAKDNGEYGIAAFVSTKGRYEHNVTSGSDEAGIYLGDSPQADSVVRKNVSYDNGIGIFLRDASGGRVTHNEAFGNCFGILFVNTGGGISDWVARHNRVTGNNRACAASEDAPAFSGGGIVDAGATDIEIVHNVVTGNHPTGPTFASGGIVLVSLPPGTVTDTNVRKNVAFGNGPVDIFWDQTGTGNVFQKNRCETSDPDGLCGNTGAAVATTTATGDDTTSGRADRALD